MNTALVARLALAGILLVSASLHSQTKGGRSVTFRDPSGDEVAFYQNSYALLIGVADYTHGWDRLDAVAEELDSVESVLGEHGFQVLREMNPTGAELVQLFEDFLDKYGYESDNRLLVFFSGHGYTRDGGKKGYLVPTDAPDPQDDEVGFLQKAVNMTRIRTMAREIEARHVLFVFDSCFSGTIFKTRGRAKQPAHISARTAKPVRQFITAGSAGEEVPAFSTFTPYFVRALRGEGDLNNDGYVTGVELGTFLHDEIVGGEIPQTPQFGKLRDPDFNEGDFVFPLPEITSQAPAHSDARSPGLYLRRDVNAKARLRRSMFHKVETTADNPPVIEQPVGFSLVDTGCFLHDMKAGEVLKWTDVRICSD